MKRALNGRLAGWLKWTLSTLVIGTALILALSAPPSVGAEKTSTLDPGANVGTAPAAAPIVVPEEILGVSGRLRAWIGTPEAIDASASIKPLLAGIPYREPGVYRLPVTTSDGDSISVLSMRSLSDAASRVGAYRIGSWPSDALTASRPQYRRPDGFIEVTPENRRTSVSKHFALEDFLTHDQQDVWPKVLVIRPRLVDKLELLEAELDREGLPSRLHVMSGFRTPQYNEQGVGEGGRASHSRHMYGDASDVFVDEDQDGMMDDLDGDGRITVRDALVLRAAAERVEAAHPELVGGIGAYPSNGVHGPFVHVDTRGYRARWGASPVRTIARA